MVAAFIWNIQIEEKCGRNGEKYGKYLNAFKTKASLNKPHN